MTSTHAIQKKPPRPRKPRDIIPAELQGVYADVAAKAGELRRQGKTHMEVCEELNRLGYRTRTGKPWRHPQQIIKLLRSFGGEG
ncbi:MAG: recombinase family protein [Planctomycetes bacterium]|nr:recombinase family protein [Planctomycetota bacterium]